MTGSAAPQVGDRWVNAALPDWSPWRTVTVQQVDLLGSVTAAASDGRTYCFPSVTFLRDYRPAPAGA
jgi:hypothetical protein